MLHPANFFYAHDSIEAHYALCKFILGLFNSEYANKPCIGIHLINNLHFVLQSSQFCYLFCRNWSDSSDTGCYWIGTCLEIKHKSGRICDC